MQINTNIQDNLTPEEKEIFSILREVVKTRTPSTKLYAVGGWTRDKLLGIPSDDIDIMVDNLSGEDFAHLVTNSMGIKSPHIIRENPDASKHIQTAKAYIPLSSGKIQEVDFARARSEIYPEGTRIPEIKPATPEEDASRRDLTINSIFYNVMENKLEDFTGKGIKDLITGTIRTPTDPLKTFSDDPLRIFRVIRFSAKYNGTINPETYQAMMNPSLRQEIKEKISRERIGTEITKMLKNPNPEKALSILKDTGLWQDIITEALKGTKYEGKMKELDMEQNNPYHKLNLWSHTMEVVKNVLEKYPEAEPEKRATIILSALMHDLGKLFVDIQSESKTHPGRTSYIGHEKESRELVEHILRYLKMEPFIQEVSGLARNHMRPHTYVQDSSLKTLRKFIRQMGEKSLNYLDIFNIAMADALSKDVIKDPSVIQEYQNLESKLQEALLSLGPLNEKEAIPPILNGNEVMQILNIKPGQWMSNIMEFVRELRDENPNITKEEAANLLKEKYQEIKPEDISKMAQNKKEEEKEKTTTCPMTLFKKKVEEIDNALKEKKYYEVTAILEGLNQEYKDEKILRLIALNMFKLLLIDGKYRHNDLLQEVFTNAETNFFDSVLCSFVLGTLLLIDTATEDEVLMEIANRMIKMSPGTIKTVLNMLPDKINRPHLKKEIENKLNEDS